MDNKIDITANSGLAININFTLLGWFYLLYPFSATQLFFGKRNETADNFLYLLYKEINGTTTITIGISININEEKDFLKVF